MRIRFEPPEDDRPTYVDTVEREVECYDEECGWFGTTRVEEWSDGRGTFTCPVCGCEVETPER